MKVKIITAENSDELEEKINKFITYREETNKYILYRSIRDIKFDNNGSYVSYIQYEDITMDKTYGARIEELKYGNKE